MIHPPPEKKRKKKSRTESLERNVRALEAQLKTANREKKMIRTQKKRMEEEVVKLKGRIRDLEPKASSYDLKKIEARIKTIKMKLTNEAQEKRVLQSKNEELKSEIALLSKALGDKYGDNDISSILYNLSKYKTQNHDLLQELGARDEKITNLTKSLTEKSQRLESFDSTFRSLQDENDHFKELNEQYVEELDEMKNEVKILIDKMQEMQDEKKSVNIMKEKVREYENLQTEFTVMMNDKEKFEQGNMNLTRKITRMESEIELMAQNQRRYERQIRKLTSTKNSVSANLEKKVKQLDQFARINNELRMSSEKAKQDLTLVFQRMKRLNVRNTALVNQINQSKAAETELLSKFQNQLQDKERSVLHFEQEQRDLVDENDKILDLNKQLRQEVTRLKEKKDAQQDKLNQIEQNKSMMQLTLLDHLKEQRGKVKEVEDRNRVLRKKQESILGEYKKLQILYEANSAINLSRRNISVIESETQRENNNEQEEDVRRKRNAVRRDVPRGAVRVDEKNLLLNDSRYENMFDNEGNLAKKKRKNVLLQSLE